MPEAWLHDEYLDQYQSRFVFVISYFCYVGFSLWARIRLFYAYTLLKISYLGQLVILIKGQSLIKSSKKHKLLVLKQLCYPIHKLMKRIR